MHVYNQAECFLQIQTILLYKVGVAIKFATVFQAPGPGENAGNWVGAGRPSL